MASDTLSNYGLFDQHIMATGYDAKTEAEEELRKLEKTKRLWHTQERFIELVERQKKELTDIDEAERGYFNDAWPEAARAYRERERLPVHNINMLLPQVKIIAGGEYQNRKELRLLPVERDDEKRAELYGIILQYMSKVNNDRYYEQMMLEEGVIAKRSHQEIYWDYSEDPYGELKTVNRPARDVLRDVDANDLASMTGDISVRVHMEWISIKDLQRRYQSKNIEWQGLVYTTPDDKIGRKDVTVGGVDDRYDYPSQHYPQYFWRERRMVRLIRMWERDFKTVYRLLDLNPEIDNADNVFIDDFDSEQEATKTKLQMSLAGYNTEFFVIQEAQSPYWSYHVISGYTELEWKPDIGRYAPWADYYAINLHGKIAGLWDIIKDRQQYINYTNSKVTEAVGRSGQATVWRENSFRDDLNPALAIRDGQPIVVKADTWDKLNGQPPFYTVPNKGVEYIAPLLSWTQDMKNDIQAMVNTGLVPAGASQGGVTAASGLAILQQESNKATSSFGANLLFMRAQKAKLRLYMLHQKYRQTPTLIKLKLEKIFGSVLQQSGSQELKKTILTGMLDGSMDLDKLLRDIRNFKYDIEFDIESNGILEKNMMLQGLQMAIQFGLQPDPQSVLEALSPLLSHSVRERLLEGVKAKQQQVQEMMSNPAGQLQLEMDEEQKKKAKDGNTMVSKNNLAPGISNPLQNLTGLA